MAKVTDYNEIMTEVTTQLSESDWSILDYVDEETAKLIVTNIYTSNDVMKGYGQDIRGWISVISSRYYISVIRADEMGMFKSDVPICGYENKCLTGAGARVCVRAGSRVLACMRVLPALHPVAAVPLSHSKVSNYKQTIK